MPPISPEMIAAGLTAGPKFFAGIGQLFGGMKALKRLKQPEYDIQPEFTKNVGIGQTVKGMGMAPEVYSRGIRAIDRNALFGLNALGDRRGVTAGIGNIVQRMNDATADLTAQDASIRNQNFVTGSQMESQANTNLGLQKIAKWEWEKANPYMRKMQSAQANVGAGIQNLFGGFSDFGNMFMINKMNQSGGSRKKGAGGLSDDYSNAASAALGMIPK